MKSKRYLFLIIILFGALGMDHISQGAVISPPWSTSFADCTSDWNQGTTLPADCGNYIQIYNSGAYCQAGGTTSSSITAAANYSGGAGGRGFRYYLGQSTWPQMDNSATFQFDMNYLREVWVRVYFRYGYGAHFGSGGNWQKIHYFFSAVSGGKNVILDWLGADAFQVTTQNGQPNIVCSSGCGFATLYPDGPTFGGMPGSDGTWHSLEVHLKMDTDGTDGIFDMWLDGVQKMQHTNVNYGGMTEQGWRQDRIFVNESNPQNNPCVEVDVDDVAVSTTGYIGPLNFPSDTTPPSAPSGLSVI